MSFPLSPKIRARPRTVLPVVIFSLALIVFLGGLGWATWTYIISPPLARFDFYWVWAGGRAVLNGQNPYGMELTRQIQEQALGAYMPLIGYQFEFSYPASIALIFLPFVGLPYPEAILLWNTLQIPLLGGALAAGSSLLKQRITPAAWADLLLLSFFGFRFPAIVYSLGQVTILILFCGVLAAWLYVQGHPRWAALALAVTSIRPDMAVIAAALAFLLTRHSRQRKEFWVVLLLAGAALLIFPMLFIGFWPSGWLPVLQNYARLNPYIRWPLAGLGSTAAAWVALGLLAAWAGAAVWRAWRRPSQYHQKLAVSAVLILAQLGLTQTGLYNLTYMLVPAFILWSCAPRLWLRGLILGSLLSPWLLFTLVPESEINLLAVPLQFLILHWMVVWASRPGRPSDILPMRPS